MSVSESGAVGDVASWNRGTAHVPTRLGWSPTNSGQPTGHFPGPGPCEADRDEMRLSDVVLSLR